MPQASESICNAFAPHLEATIHRVMQQAVRQCATYIAQLAETGKSSKEGARSTMMTTPDGGDASDSSDSSTPSMLCTGVYAARVSASWRGYLLGAHRHDGV